MTEKKIQSTIKGKHEEHNLRTKLKYTYSNKGHKHANQANPSKYCNSISIGGIRKDVVQKVSGESTKPRENNHHILS